MDWSGLTIHGHLVNLGGVVQFDVAEDAHIIACDEVNSNTFPAESSATADAVDVVFTVGGKVIVNDKRDLLDINTTGPDVSGDENS